jgi:23S rRNA (cytosine1962-C5)-methyltransferase
LVHRLKVALSFRERLYSRPFYRLIYGESDGIPGLVVDRYDDVLVAQISTAGMERLREELLDALYKVLAPRAVLWRNDGPLRTLEGLDAYVATARGQAPESIELPEHGARFRVAPGKGQKTGWFFDHYDNRATIRRYAAGRRVLDLFCYSGAWGIQAALGDASNVLCADASAPALEALRHNVDLNGVGDRVEALEGDAFQVLQDLHDAGERFDVVVLDPPAFIKRPKDARNGAQGYRRINQLAMRVLTRDGILISCSCSQHLQAQQHVDLMLAAARHLERSLSVFRQGHQAADHPVHPAIPETAYLKSLAVRVLPA